MPAMVSEDEERSGSIPTVQAAQETTDEEIQKWVASERDYKRDATRRTNPPEAQCRDGCGG